MFILHSSNKTENLVAHLAAVIQAAPLSSVFAQEVFLIQSQGMERWLAQQLAEYGQVWANFNFLFPSAFFTDITARLHDNSVNAAGFERHLLLWRIEALLRDLDGAVFKPLQDFLGGDNPDLKRYQLARQLATIFDQYQLLRPDLLESWRQGRHQFHTDVENWQSRLWQAITAEIGVNHRGELWRQTITILQQAPAGAWAAALPERISVFGVNSLPPLLLAYLHALSRHCDVHLFILNPVQGYWADLPNKRLQLQLAEFSVHPLLVSLGQQGREFQQLLLEQVEFQFEPSSFEISPASNNLQQLQNDILANQIPQLQLHADQSILIHSCHSRLREVQVLKDQLLEVLETQPDIELRDIIVMAPDIQLYAPFISAVFADIQHAIADRSLRIDNHCLNALLSFLSLSQSRFGWQSVLDLLEQPLIYSSFGLTQDDMELIRYWVAETQVRWGKSAAHLQALDLPPMQQNTWQAALDRLFMGYAVGCSTEFVDQVLPYADIEGSSSQALGGLNDFLQLLFKAGAELQTPKSFSDWQMLLTAYATRLFGNADALELQALYELLAEIAEIAEVNQQPVSLPVLIAWLSGRMDESVSSNGFLRGQLTFCAMLPMRTIPFQVIALLGLNDGEFPKIQHNPSFDLLAQQPRLGDRSRRADDRYQFLEILLSVRRRLIITYIGQSQRDNSEIPPSVIVSELLDILENGYQLKNLLVRHPLHAFSSRYFNAGNSQLFSYAQPAYATACRLQTAAVDNNPWWQGVISIEQSSGIAIAELFDFYRHPQRFFLQQLGIRIPQLAAEPAEREPFALDSLSRYSIQQQCLAEMLNGGNPDLANLQAQGRWLPGALGQIVWQRQLPELAQFAEQIKSLNLGEPQPPQAIDVRLGEYQLVGKLDHLYANGSLFYRYSKLKGRDFIGAWLHHLLINQVAPQTTHLLGLDLALQFPPELATVETLQAMLDVFIQGRQRPDAFFTEAAFYYLLQQNPDTALDKVVLQVAEQIAKGYEPEMAQLLAYQDLHKVFDAGFARQCQMLLGVAWSAAL